MDFGYKIQIKGKNLVFLMASYNNKEKKCFFPRTYGILGIRLKELSPTDPNPKKRAFILTGRSLAIGLSFGLMFGLLFENLLWGMLFGVLIGIGVDSQFAREG